MRFIPPLLLVPASLFLVGSCGDQRTHITIVHSYSLTSLVREAAALFERNNPGIRVGQEASGSLEAALAVAGQRKRPDLVALADPDLISRFLIPQHVTRGYRFLGDEIVLAGRDNLVEGASAAEEWRESWYVRLSRGDFLLGVPDPDVDASGYQTHLVWKLSEIHFQSDGLYRRFLSQTERHPRHTYPELIQLLRTGTIDAAFLFQSTAQLENLDYTRLPSSLSLGDPGQAPIYARVFHKVGGPDPSLTFEIVGAPIRYGLCRLRDSAPESELFLTFLLSDVVRDLGRRQGFKVGPVEVFQGSPGR